MRGLRSLGIQSESYGSLLSSVLMNKLPQEIRLIVSREVKDGELDLDRVMKVVEGEIDARERASATCSTTSQATRKHSKEFPTAAAMTSSANAPHCSYCRQSHSSGNCRTVTDLQERKKILMKEARCFICLRRYHWSRECCSSVKCSNCGGRHHSSICDRN